MIKTLTITVFALSVGFGLLANVAHAAAGDDITCKIGCWASTTSMGQASTSEAASNATSLGLVAKSDALV